MYMPHDNSYMIQLYVECVHVHGICTVYIDIIFSGRFTVQCIVIFFLFSKPRGMYLYIFFVSVEVVHVCIFLSHEAVTFIFLSLKAITCMCIYFSIFSNIFLGCLC